MARKKRTAKSVETLTHEEASRKNLPSAEHQPLMRDEEQRPIRIAYERRNRDLDPQLVWRGKDAQDWSDLVVNAPPLYIQERVHPKALIDDLVRISVQRPVAGGREEEEYQHSFSDFFGDFNGLPSAAATTEFYQHDANWSNRMILGDSLQVMASLAEREGLRGKVQCIYLDPPTASSSTPTSSGQPPAADVRDGNKEHITREPEQVKAFRDTWRDGIHSYLTYLRDRLTVARDLLTESGSIFVQIGDENVHRVRALMDEVFGEENFVSLVAFVKTGGLAQEFIKNKCDYIIWYSRDREKAKSRNCLLTKLEGGAGASKYTGIQLSDGVRITLAQARLAFGDERPTGSKTFRLDTTTSEANPIVKVDLRMGTFSGRWKTNVAGMQRLELAGRIQPSKRVLNYVRFIEDYPVQEVSNVWDDIGGIQSRADPKVYVVQTATEAIKRCILMTTDPGDLVLDPTCGSGTTAYVAEQWGRRWITIDTSRVALALARARIMGARYPYYLLADSLEGQAKEEELTGRAASESATYDRIRQGFVYERVPHITLGAIANNTEIDVIWEAYEERLAPLRQQLSEASGQWSANSGEGDSLLSTDNRPLEEWEITRERPDDWPSATELLLAAFWELRIARQQEIDASIARSAEYEYLYDKPYADRNKVRVAGPFTVESISPHRVLAVDENDEFVEGVAEPKGEYGETIDFASVILDNLRTSGVQQAHKEDRISFTSVTPWPGAMVCAEGLYTEGGTDDGAQRRAAIFIGPEFGTVSRADLVDAAREAADGNFDVLISCAFNYEAHSTEFERLGKIPVLKARMSPDLHMADELKNTGNGNLFVIFGEPDIDILDADDGQIKVQINGVDVFVPNSGDMRSDEPNKIPCWFIDTDYNGESFFVRHAYFPGTNNDPYKSLKTTLKAEINREAWESLRSDTSRPFDRPESGRIAVKVINHLGDEVMKVFRA